MPVQIMYLNCSWKSLLDDDAKILLSEVQWHGVLCMPIMCVPMYGNIWTIFNNSSGTFRMFSTKQALGFKRRYIFDNFTIFKYILAMAIGNYDIIPQEVVAHTSSFMQEVVNPHISQQYRNINGNYYKLSSLFIYL